MVLAYNINIAGLKELQDKFAKMPEVLQKEVRGVVESSAKDFVRYAKRDAPVNKEKHGGNLRLGISYAQVIADKTHTTFEVVSNAHYSAYLEWGTITKVSVPAELAAYASQFKGKGLRKTGGIFPHPYFFRQIPLIKKQLENDIKDIASRL